jgi:hypothetical protein
MSETNETERLRAKRPELEAEKRSPRETQENIQHHARAKVKKQSWLFFANLIPKESDG